MNLIKSKIEIASKGLDFELPKYLECSQPTEERGIDRDEVGLMVSHYQNDLISHTQFNSLGAHLLPGDTLVFNTSGTLPAALSALDATGRKLSVHISTQSAAPYWVVEIREQTKKGPTKRYFGNVPGETLHLENGGSLEIIKPYYSPSANNTHLQLWVVQFHLEEDILSYLERHGKAIRYGYQKKNYPLSYYQTVFARERGSAEMPSAGRAFTPRLVADLVSRGIVFAPVLLHTGVASLELQEKPYDEYYRVPATTADLVNLARAEGRRVIAIGTTSIRALETVTNQFGETQAGEGWTNTFITPERGIYGIDGLITGFHEPRASHLLMLETLAGKAHLEYSYQTALAEKYLWHEFGDLHLILP